MNKRLEHIISNKISRQNLALWSGNIAATKVQYYTDIYPEGHKPAEVIDKLNDYLSSGNTDALAEARTLLDSMAKKAYEDLEKMRKWCYSLEQHLDYLEDADECDQESEVTKTETTQIIKELENEREKVKRQDWAAAVTQLLSIPIHALRALENPMSQDQDQVGLWLGNALSRLPIEEEEREKIQRDGILLIPDLV